MSNRKLYGPNYIHKRCLVQVRHHKVSAIATNCKPSTGTSGNRTAGTAPVTGDARSACLRHLDNVTGKLARAYLADPTRNSYGVGARRFLKFCLQTGEPFKPTTAIAIRRFGSSMYEEGCCHCRGIRGGRTFNACCLQTARPVRQ